MDFILPHLIADEEDLALPREPTSIQSFYTGATVLITGATGFLGKLLLEKLLRTCPGVAKVYLLVRLKYHYDTRERIDNLFEVPLFENLNRTQPDARTKVELIRGDLGSPNLGLSTEDVEALAAETSVVLHCASTSPFEESLRVSVDVNVKGLRDLIRVGRKMRHLKAFVHVSSAFVNCPKGLLDETLLKPFVSSGALVEFVDCFDQNFRSVAKPINLGKYPNNYLFTKSMAEDIIATEASNLPVAIVRPTLIIPTAKRPFAGWLDNVNGICGLVMTIYLGLTKSVLAKKDARALVIPADHAVSAILAAAWDVGVCKALNENQEVIGADKEQVTIYNLIGNNYNALTWGKFFKLCSRYGRKIPSAHIIRYPWHFVHENKTLHFHLTFVFHYLIAYFYDYFPFSRNGAKYIGYYNKIDALSKILSFYTLNGWEIETKNLGALWSKMSVADRQLFDFNLRMIDWDMYLFNFVLGIREYILRDSIASLAEGVRSYQSRQAIVYLGLLGLALFFALVVSLQ